MIVVLDHLPDLSHRSQGAMKLTAFARARHGLLVLAASLGLVFGLSAVPAQAATTTSTSGN
ncbi:hypothetical protein ACFW96_28730 [Streptomyces gardneri]|uniref:hypothetical protein n=1 Tax=Streptomyces gardneri TaxID=66892 RepID=UPI0036923C31